MTVAVAVVQPLLTGRIYSEAESLQLLEGIRESSLYLSSAIATASVTTLALMLTLLSLASRADTDFDYDTYKGIELIGRLSTATFIGSVTQLLMLSFPIGEYENIGEAWFKVLYYMLSSLNGLLTGLMVVGVLVLFDTIITLIKKLSPDIN
ncbi:hypothetical protein S7335_1963 [Synechococcus sp. PCC 7335]|uniref:hypothetical protein n=1 Tax=Synechococcus sp. (strain ATCC 29403 / PCC 7335) TaxID=91464 RepID=UPI00017EE403|nr:hypothetical protein [Synechococcus sp. PCC 7335]EDX84266.1 hypothetical protein S7335_1963 [Synechococcus sp. PCC 7335]